MPGTTWDDRRASCCRGVRLARVMEWRADRSAALAPVEEEFIEAALARQEHEERAVRAEARRHVVANRRLRALLGVAVVLLLLAGGSAVLAQRNAQRAEVAATTAEARQVGALAQVTDDAPKALLLALAAARLDPSQGAGADLQSTIARHPELIRTAYLPGSESGLMGVSPDGRRLVVHDTSGGVFLYDADTLSLLADAQLGPAIEGWQGTPVEFSPDGDELAVAAVPSDEPPLRLVDAETLEPLPRQLGGWPPGQLRADGAAYSDDGSRVAVTVTYAARSGPRAAWSRPGLERSMLLVWDRDRPERPVRRIGLDGSQGVQISPDGDTVWVAGPFTSYDVDSGREVARNDAVYSWLFFEPNPDHTEFVAQGYAQGHRPSSSSSTPPPGRSPGGSTGCRGSTASSWPGRRTARTSPAPRRTAPPWCGTRRPATSSTRSAPRTPRPTGWPSAGTAERCTRVAPTGRSRPGTSTGYRSFLRRVPLTEEVAIESAFIRPSPDGGTLALQQGFPGDRHEIRFIDVDEDRTQPAVELPDDRAWGAGGWSPDGTRFAAGYGDGWVKVVGVQENEVVRAGGPARAW